MAALEVLPTAANTPKIRTRSNGHIDAWRALKRDRNMLPSKQNDATQKLVYQKLWITLPSICLYFDYPQPDGEKVETSGCSNAVYPTPFVPV